MKISKELYTKIENKINEYEKACLISFEENRNNISFVNCQYTSFIWFVFHNSIDNDIRAMIKDENLLDSHIETALKKILKKYDTGFNNEEIKKKSQEQRQEKQAKKQAEKEKRNEAKKDKIAELCYSLKEEKYLKGEHFKLLAEFFDIKISDNFLYFLSEQLVCCDGVEVKANCTKIHKNYLNKLNEIIIKAKGV